MAVPASCVSPIHPASPYLNSEVDHSQETGKLEFHVTTDLDDPELDDRLDEWRHYKYWRWPQGALNGKTTMQKVCELGNSVPLWEDASALYALHPLHQAEKEFLVPKRKLIGILDKGTHIGFRLFKIDCLEAFQ